MHQLLYAHHRWPVDHSALEARVLHGVQLKRIQKQVRDGCTPAAEEAGGCLRRLAREAYRALLGHLRAARTPAASAAAATDRLLTTQAQSEAQQPHLVATLKGEPPLPLARQSSAASFRQ